MKNKLNPMIRVIAEQYKFEIEWCDVLNHWNISHESSCCSFFWRDDYDSFEDFFNRLKAYLEEIGGERCTIFS